MYKYIIYMYIASMGATLDIIYTNRQTVFSFEEVWSVKQTYVWSENTDVLFVL